MFVVVEVEVEEKGLFGGWRLTFITTTSPQTNTRMKDKKRERERERERERNKQEPTPSTHEQEGCELLELNNRSMNRNMDCVFFTVSKRGFRGCLSDSERRERRQP